MSVAYPDWTPPELLAIIEADSHPLQECISMDVLMQLATAPDMERVWRSLSRRERARPSHFTYVDVVLGRAQFEARGPDSWERKTKAEQAKELQAIENAANALADLLERSDSGLNDSVLYFLDQERLSEFAKLFRIPEEILWQPHIGAVSRIDDVELPMMARSLRILAAVASDRREEPKWINNPNAKGARRIYFARRMSHYMQETYGTPLHHVVAGIARIFLDDPSLDESTVRADLRFWRP